MSSKELSYNLRMWRHFFVPLFTLLLVSIIGIIGFMWFNRSSFLEAFYMVVVTLTTVGYRQDEGLSTAGILFDSFFVLVSIILLVVVIGRALEFIISGEFVKIRRLRRMEKKIEWMKDHYIICGFGRVGHQVAKDFEASKIPYVVIDIKEETADELEGTGTSYIIGDVTAENLLENAGAARARGLVACNDSDVANVFVTLSARAVNKDLYIVARASTPATEEKMKMAGANRVISPYFIAGHRLAAMATKPVVSDFLDTVMHGEHLEFSLREISLPENSALMDKTLAETEIRQRSGATILAIRRADGGFDLQPLAGTKFSQGDVAVAIGTHEKLDLLDKMV